jgi:hypothetical protein
MTDSRFAHTSLEGLTAQWRSRAGTDSAAGFDEGYETGLNEAADDLTDYIRAHAGDNIRAPLTVTVGGTEYDALTLAAFTDAEVPEYGSAGEAWLTEVAEAYNSSRDEIRDEAGHWQDAISEECSRLSDQSTTTTWQVVTDLKLFYRQDHFDWGLYADQFDWVNPRSFHTEKVTAVRIDKVDDMLSWWLHEIAGQLLYELRQADLEANPVEDDETEDDEG